MPCHSHSILFIIFLVVAQCSSADQQKGVNTCLYSYLFQLSFLMLMLLNIKCPQYFFFLYACVQLPSTLVVGYDCQLITRYTMKYIKKMKGKSFCLAMKCPENRRDEKKIDKRYVHFPS